MLKDRLRTSAVLISIAVALIYLDVHYPVVAVPGLWLIPLLLFFGLGTAWDVTSLILASGRQVARVDALVATGMVTLAAAIPTAEPGGRMAAMVLAAMAAIFFVFLREMNRYARGETGVIERTCASVFVSLYIGLPMGLLVVLRTNESLAALLTMIVVTKSTDAGAYFSGKTFGKHKLVPRLSPGKTWEGAIGGVVIATIVAFACLSQLFPALMSVAAQVPSSAGESTTGGAGSPLAQPWVGALVLGPTLAIAGMIGDLAESLIKRDSGAKDSGQWLPGLGGVWDVTDSLIAAAMPAVLCFAAGVGG